MKIIITEEQEKMLHNIFLQEAALPEFSLDTLNSLSSFKQRMEYCRKYLGEPIGRGSSRIVFQIDDEKVLKLAKNSKGIAQNEYEYDSFYHDIEDVMVKVYDIGDDNLWVISEFVLPAKEQDFQHIFGFSFKVFCSFISRTIFNYADAKTRFFLSRFRGLMDENQWEELIDNNENAQSIEYYLSNYQPEEFADYFRIVNWGLTTRNGEPHLVILDNGLNQEIYNKFYRR